MPQFIRFFLLILIALQVRANSHCNDSWYSGMGMDNDSNSSWSSENSSNCSSVTLLVPMETMIVEENNTYNGSGSGDIEEEEGDSSSDTGLSTAALAGIAVGSVVGVAVVVLIVGIVTFAIIKALKPRGSKVTPLAKGKTQKETVELGKPSLVAALPKPE